MNNRKILLQNIIFFFGLFLLNLSFFASRIDIVKQNAGLIEICSYIIFTTLILKNFSTNKLKTSVFILVSLATTLSIVSAIITKSPLLLRIILLILSSNSLKFRDIVKIDLLTKVIIFFIIFFSYQLGILGDDTIIWRDNLARVSLGFQHPNTLSIFCLFTLLDFVYIYGNKQKVASIILAFLIWLIATIVTDTRSVTIITSIVILALIAKKWFSRILDNNFLHKLSPFLYLILIVASITLTLVFNENKASLNQFNLLLSNRIEYQAFYLKNYDINFLGNNIEYIEKQAMDNSFFQLAIHYGIISIIFFYFIFSNLFKQSFDKKDYALIIITFCILALGIMERAIILPVFNIFLIYPLIDFKKEQKNV